MRDKWYGDNRDLVKWGVLLALAERCRAKHILQVAYYRESEWPELELAGEAVSLPDAVIRHFRWVPGIVKIEASVPIEVMTEPFGDRDDYQRAVIERIRRRPAAPGIVLLDPDTGLESRRPSLNHVLHREVGELWRELTIGDLLVLYQHQTNRNGRAWIPRKKKQFAQAIGCPLGSVNLARCEKIARDVVLFYAQKAG